MEKLGDSLTKTADVLDVLAPVLNPIDRYIHQKFTTMNIKVNTKITKGMDMELIFGKMENSKALNM